MTAVLPVERLSGTAVIAAPPPVKPVSNVLGCARAVNCRCLLFSHLFLYFFINDKSLFYPQCVSVLNF